jgi:hypothetical protein
LGLGDYSYESSADCWLDTIEPTMIAIIPMLITCK